MDESENEKQFSVIKFFHAFQRELKKVNKFPVSPDNLVVHQDLAKMLGDEDVEMYYPFASLVMDRPRSFEDLMFSLELYNSSFFMSIDQQYPFEVEYDEFNLDEDDLAGALIDIMVGLANGQILTLNTLIDDTEQQAAEIIYRQKDAKLYTVLRTFAFYTRKAKDKDANYSTIVHRNDYDIKEVKFDIKLLERLVPLSLDTAASNRKPFADITEPLRREVYKKNTDISNEIMSQNAVAKWLPGYNPRKKRTKFEKFVEYSYYRYVEVVTITGTAVILLTLDSRPVNTNILMLAGVVVFAFAGSLYLRKIGYAMWLFRVAAYLAAVGYVVFFYGIVLEGFWMWLIALVAFEPIIEMLVVDFHKLLKNNEVAKGKEG